MALTGIDISKYQAGIDMKAVPADIVIVGTSDGSYINPVADQHVQAAKASGKLVGVWHYFRNDPLTDDRFWAKHTEGYQDGKTVFFLDAETAHPNLPALCLQFEAEFKRLTGIKVVVYTYWHLLQAYNWQGCVDADLGLWGAWYPLGEQRIDGYQSPAYWGESLMGWQFTSTGYLPGWGDRLDLNEFYLDAKGWYAYSAKNGVAATPARAPTKPAIKPVLAPAAKPAAAGTYKVKLGDNLTAIAAKFGTTYTELARINGIPNPDLIQPGQVLKVTGGAAPEPAKPATYKVRGGDSLSSIATAHGTTWQKLAQFNGLANPD